ncbi:urocortin-3 [Suncus etruscus]|uniref:urocortin-3 n=1 Tax=Suncus etruscus TaxID=109475 RepID=UPI0021105040|nr:urocortin-3 [Suncus etruscus]
MLAPTRFLMLLLLLLPPGTPSPDLPPKFYKVKFISSCINAALSGAKGDQLEGPLPQSKRNFFMEEIQEEQKGKREVEMGKRSPLGVARYKAPNPQLRGKLPQDKAKSNRRAQFTLSLDVPTNIMNVLFDIAKAKNVRAKAAANAQLLAQVGRR